MTVNRKKVVVPALIAAFAAISMPAAAAETGGKEQQVKWKAAGVSIHTQISMDRNWPPASMNHARINGTLGSGVEHGMVEPAVVPLNRCPKNAKIEYKILAGTHVVTFDDSLDQLMYRTTDGYCCIFEDGSITAETISEVTGGTGRYKGATGKLIGRVSPEAVSFPEWKGEFNNSISTTEGTLVLAHQDQPRRK